MCEVSGSSCASVPEQAGAPADRRVFLSDGGTISNSWKEKGECVTKGQPVREQDDVCVHRFLANKHKLIDVWGFLQSEWEQQHNKTNTLLLCYNGIYYIYQTCQPFKKHF